MKMKSSVCIVMMLVIALFMHTISIAAPTVTITQPTNNSIITGVYTVRATITGGDIKVVKIYVDGLEHSDMNYSGGIATYSLDTRCWQDGTHTIKVKAIDSTCSESSHMVVVQFDNLPPVFKNVYVLYPEKQYAAKNGENIRIIANITDTVSKVKNASCVASSLGFTLPFKMYDDGKHADFLANDGCYATDPMKINLKSGYYYVYVYTEDTLGHGTFTSVVVLVNNEAAMIHEIRIQYPEKQTAAKSGDKIRIIAKIGWISRDLDVVLTLDNSGSMRYNDQGGTTPPTKMDNLKTAAKTFIGLMTEKDRVAIWAFDPLSPGAEDPKLYLPFTVTNAAGKNTANSTIDSLWAQCNTPLWDTIGSGIQYAITNPSWRLPVVIGMTDGDDWGTGGQETGSETWCPGAPAGTHGNPPPATGGMTWGVAAGNVYGQSAYYGTINRYTYQNYPPTPGTPCVMKQFTKDGYLKGLWSNPILTFTIGLGTFPQSENASAPGYLPKTDPNWPFTTDFELNRTATTTTGAGIRGMYFYAPNSAQLLEIYKKIKGMIHTGGPKKIIEVLCNVTSIGHLASEPMYDDGKHGDGAAGDSWYGTELLEVRTTKTDFCPAIITAYDLARNPGRGIKMILVDNTPPKVSDVKVYYLGSYPAKDGDKINVTANASDFGTVAGIYNAPDIGGVWIDTTNIGGDKEIPTSDMGPIINPNDGKANDHYYANLPNTITVQTSNGTGSFPIGVVARDQAYNMDVQWVNIEVDNGKITVKLIAPLNNEFVEGKYTFRASVNDPSIVKKVELKLTGASTLDAIMSYHQSGEYRYEVDTTSLPDGKYQCQVTVYDIYGKTVSTPQVSFNIDNKPPLLVIKLPKQGEIVTGVYTIDITGSDDTFKDYTQYNVDCGDWIPIPPTWKTTFQWDTTQLSEGKHTVGVRAVDKIGHITIGHVDVIVDNAGPTIKILTPSKGQYLKGTYVFTAKASDNVKIHHVDITIFDTTTRMSYNTVEDIYEYTVDTSAVKDGEYTANVTVYDIFGRVSTDGVIFKADNHPPTLSIASPLEDQIIENTYELVVNSQDFETPKVYYKIDTTDWILMKGTMPRWTANLDTKLLSDGKHTITVKSEDIVGHVTQTSLHIRVDNRPPKITQINMPPKIVTGKWRLIVNVSDEVGIANVYITIESGKEIEIFRNLKSGFYEYVMNTKEFPHQEGWNEYSIIARDLQWYYTQHKDKHESILQGKINVDNLAPRVEWLDPDTNIIHKGNVSINVTVQENNTYQVYIRFDNGSWIVYPFDIEHERYVYTWKTTTKDNGIHLIEVKIVDEAGNEQIMRKYIKIENIDYSWTMMILVLMIAIVIFVVFAIVRYKQRKKPRKFMYYKPLPPPPPPQAPLPSQPPTLSPPPPPPSTVWTVPRQPQMKTKRKRLF